MKTKSFFFFAFFVLFVCCYMYAQGEVETVKGFAEEGPAYGIRGWFIPAVPAVPEPLPLPNKVPRVINPLLIIAHDHVYQEGLSIENQKARCLWTCPFCDRANRCQRNEGHQGKCLHRYRKWPKFLGWAYHEWISGH